ncbi:hypothetical protein RvY_07098 [Ramazzottius varieornatus]|uniref:Uncharacterized protein n=1 Tax=Ramazzottius varieornatus TaxID=947166 RepID=A0A1D1V740_RAMVA|nr:hypothetical protein RvY_07098 [Ramazzottius varieornatus]
MGDHYVVAHTVYKTLPYVDQNEADPILQEVTAKGQTKTVKRAEHGTSGDQIFAIGDSRARPLLYKMNRIGGSTVFVSSWSEGVSYETNLTGLQPGIDGVHLQQVRNGPLEQKPKILFAHMVRDIVYASFKRNHN